MVVRHSDINNEVDMTELEQIAKRLDQATSYLDVFGHIEGDEATKTKKVQTLYRALARAVHPDSFTLVEEKKLAQATFVRLQQFKQDALKAICDNSYGQVTSLAIISTKKHTYRVYKAVGGDGFTDWYDCERDSNAKLMLHIAKAPTKNAQIANEAAMLRKLYQDDTDNTYRPYLPALVDNFSYRANGVTRGSLVFRQLEGFVTLEMLKSSVPNVHPLDMAWMWRRLLVPLGFAHQNGVVHGAVLPSTIAIQPIEHGLMLGGWYSAQGDDNGHYAALTTGIADYIRWYPKEVIDKQPVSPATDITMAAKTMVWLMGGDPLTGNLPTTVPAPMRAFFKGCIQGSTHARPQNAWMLINEFDELLERLGRPYWPRKFRPFTAMTS